MSRIKPEKLHVRFTEGMTQESPVTPRRYTLTHSDITGELFLTVGSEYNTEQTSGLYARLMRDEVLAEWRHDEDGPALHVTCHVSGGLVLGPAALRDFFFRKELPLALKALRYGDRDFFAAYPELDWAPIWVHFHSNRQRYRCLERWGTPADYCTQ
ncbi:MAG: staygreen family protein [Anaerolineae bacterium]|nr:staygreen family protein [Anaerolineae bacterium]